MLNDHDWRFRHPPRPPRRQRRPFPGWASDTPDLIWIEDSTHLPSAGMTALFVADLVCRRWLSTVVSAEQTHTQVQLAFEQALDAEGLLEAAAERAEALGRPLDPQGEDPATPLLLAVSDNTSQLIAGATRTFLVRCPVPSGLWIQ